MCTRARDGVLPGLNRRARRGILRSDCEIGLAIGTIGGSRIPAPQPRSLHRKLSG